MKLKKIITASLVFATCLVSVAAVIKGTFASNVPNDVSSNYSNTAVEKVDNNGIKYKLYLGTQEMSGTNTYTTAAIQFVSGDDSGVINVPEKFSDDNILVTAVYESGFANCNATQINLPKSIKQIGKQAFLTCTNLETFSIPYKVTIIDIATFMNCTALKDVSYMSEDGKSTSKVNNNIVSINGNAFAGCRMLSSLSMPNNLNYIGRSAFKGCVYLTRVVLPSGSNSLEVDDYAFANCTLMIMAYVPNNITRFGKYVFNYNQRMSIYMSRASEPSTTDGFESEWNKQYVEKGNTSYINVYYNYGKMDITPTTDYLFSISNQPIYDNMGLHVLDSNSDNKEYAILVSYLSSVDEKTKSIDVPNIVTSTNGTSYPVKVIENLCYSANDTNKTGTLLESVIFPENIVKIGVKAFSNTPNLKSIDFSQCKNLKEISTDAFKTDGNTGNTSLTSLTFPASLEIIDGWAFENSKKLKSIEFTADAKGNYNLKAIGNSAFAGCGTSSTQASFNLNLPNSLDDNYYSSNMNVSTNNKNAYGFYGGSAIEQMAFYKNKSIANVYLNESASDVTSISIDDNAFGECEYIKSVILDSSKLYKLGYQSFAGNWSTRTIYINTSYLEVNELTKSWSDSVFGKDACATVYLSGTYPISSYISSEPPYKSWDKDISGTDFSENNFTSYSIRRNYIPVYTNMKNEVNGRSGIDRILTLSGQFDYLEYSDHIVITNGEPYPANKKIFIPEEINGLPITEIGSSAFGGFRQCNYIIYDSNTKISKIGDFAFWKKSNNGDYNINDMIIRYFSSTNPSTLPTNGGECIIPNTVKNIGEYAFMNNVFTSITIPSSTTFIGTNAFNSNVRKDSSSLVLNTANITVDSGSKKYSVENNDLYSKDYKMLFYHAKAVGGDVTINSKTNIIGFEAFSGSKITSVTLSSSVQKINGFAFNRCSNLTTVKGDLSGLQYINSDKDLKTTVDGFGQDPYDGDYNSALFINGAFSDCGSLSNVNLKGATSLVAIGVNAFKNCYKLQDFGAEVDFYTYSNNTLSQESTISNGLLDLRCDNGGTSSTDKLITIGTSAFENNNLITKIILPNSVETIGASAFKTGRRADVYVEWKANENKSGFSNTAFNYDSSLVHTRYYLVESAADIVTTSSSINYWAYYKDSNGIDRSKIVTFGTDTQAVKNYFA